MSENTIHNTPPTVVIIGGGFSGTMTAVNLLKQEKTAINVVLVESRMTVGLGLAYSTPCGEHLLNVRASGMSAFADDPNHFLNYAQKADASVTPDTFVPRKFFGQYVGHNLKEALENKGNAQSTFRHINDSAVDVKVLDSAADTKNPRAVKYKVKLKDNQVIDASFVVLALGNLSAKLPRWTSALSRDSKVYLHDPWDEARLADIGTDETILIIGTGLTAIDKLVQFEEAGHKGKIHAISRHGLFPRPHTFEPSPAEPPRTGDRKSVRKTFGAVASSSQAASDWRTVIDSLRADTQSWWAALEKAEQKRFLRHIQTYWDVHRHRMAPQISQRIEKLQEKGQLSLSGARIKSFEQLEGNNKQVKVTLTKRHSDIDTTIVFDRILNCTGPQSKLETVDSDLLHNLKASGAVKNHRLGSGIEVSDDGQIADAEGKYQSTFVAIGPMLKAQLLESVAVPELKVQAKRTAGAICKIFA